MALRRDGMEVTWKSGIFGGSVEVIEEEIPGGAMVEAADGVGMHEKFYYQGSAGCRLQVGNFSIFE